MSTTDNTVNTVNTVNILAEYFNTFKAQFAKHGHTLHQSGPGNGSGPVSFMAVHDRWGITRHLPTLADAEKFLFQIGGGHDRHE